MAPQSPRSDDYRNAVQFLHNFRESCEVGQSCIMSQHLDAIKEAPNEEVEDETPNEDRDSFERNSSLSIKGIRKDQTIECLVKLSREQYAIGKVDSQGEQPPGEVGKEYNWAFYAHQEDKLMITSSEIEDSTERPSGDA